MPSISKTTVNYELVCGLEIHAELNTESKMFCRCKNDPFNAPEPNCYTCPVCLGMPGGLPIANQKAIESTILLGLALNCKIHLTSKFDRKNYFYPDLPKGYQISQYDIPFCYDGYIDTSEGRIRIHRIHLEEDTGKLQHRELDGEKVSLIDFNRSGVPLVEIVTEADIISASQAKEYGKKIRQQLRYLGIANGDMEQGGMRLEANISIRPVGTQGLPNYKVEVKNINSFRFLEQAISYEMDRHQVVLDRNETPTQETRGWNPDKNATFPQRSKEDAKDYRYFPEPDLPPIQLTELDLKRIKEQLPESIESLKTQWVATHGIKSSDIDVALAQYDDLDLIKQLIERAASNNVNPAKLITALVNKKITMGNDAASTVAAFAQSTQTASIDPDTLAATVKEIIATNPSEYQRYRTGEKKLLNFFIGQVMREMKQKVDTEKIVALLYT